MSTNSRSEQLALLLSLLGPEASDTALASLDGDTSQRIRTSLDDYKAHPPTQDEVEDVLDEFDAYFRFAMNAVESSLADDSRDANSKDAEGLQIAEEDFDVSLEPVRKFLPPQLTGDDLHDLNRMHPYQVAHALSNESPTTISLVVRNLATDHAAKTMEFLPGSIRPDVFLQLANPTTVRKAVLEKIFQSTLERALLVEEREEEEDNLGQMVSLMRSLPKNVRMPMMDALMKSDESLGATVKSQLYQFEDIVKLGDRDIQKVLGQSSTDSLIVALQNAGEELLDRVLSNMSKRARETLQEEMEFKTNSKQAEIDAGRSEIVKVLIELEESGAISID